MTGTSFSYVSTAWSGDRRTCVFNYEIHTSSKSFALSESLSFPKSIDDTPLIQRLTRALHIALGISYYKAFVPPRITHPYSMDDNEAAFWNTVYVNGLGEFLLKNNLKRDVLARFEVQDGINHEDSTQQLKSNGVMLGIGGGKDSIVAGELLKSLDLEISGFVLATGEQLGQTKEVADVMGTELQAIERRIDRQIIDINKMDGAFNGHVPISLIFALCGCVLAAQSSIGNVVVANEASASLPQAMHDGQPINHQWSKSIEFERLFQEFIYSYVSPQLHYFSAIRPLTSLGVMKLFATQQKYFEVFTSDNSLFRLKPGIREHPRWSLDSPKSLSSYILLAPHLQEAELNKIFGRNFLNENSLQELFISLLGRSSRQVLDCVGTPNELLFSLQQLEKSGRFTDSSLMARARNEGLFKDISLLDSQPLIEDEQAFPKWISEGLTRRINERLEQS